LVERAEQSPQAARGDFWRMLRRRWPLLAAAGAAILLAIAFAVLHPPAPICIAVANSLTGPSAPAGAESVAAIELAIDQANGKGGIDGRRIELLRFDDQSTAEGARKSVPAISASPCVAVLGHYLSTASLAAAPLYKAAHIPALTGTSFVDELTTGNPYYFRAQTTASVQGRSVADYLDVLESSPTIELIYSDDSFGRSYRSGFAAGYAPGKFRSWSYDSRPDRRIASARSIADALAQASSSNIIVIGTAVDNIPDLLMALRRRGLTQAVVATGGAGSDEFLERFANAPEEKEQPGFFRRNLYATPPVILDSAGAEAQALAAAYRIKTHRLPGWITVGAYDAARIMVEALRRAHVRNRPDTVRDDRERVRAALASINSPQSGVQGLTRTLYFNSHRDIPSPIRLGVFVYSRNLQGLPPRASLFITAPRQLVLVEHPDAVNLEEEIAKSHIVKVGGRYYWRQQVVATGIDFNRLDRIDLKEGSFNVDFNLWMRFVGDADAPTRIEFPGLLDRGALDPAKLVDSTPVALPVGYDRPLGIASADQINYRLYRVVASFKGNFDLHEYPFDQQQLLIRFQNRQYPSELVTYAIDSLGLRLANNSPKTVPTDLSAFRGLQQWKLSDVRYFVDSLTTFSTFGKPSLFAAADANRFAGFNATIILKRNYGIYIVKSMIPLILLVLVVFASLFMPENAYRDRNIIPVTAILTSAVLLLSVNSQIGDVGYMVAIEYVYFGFFFLCLGSLVVGILFAALVNAGRRPDAWRIARTGQILYVTTVILMIIFFWWRYGED
jgi:branched-chain amino acid transport system substrate-binding protein